MLSASCYFAAAYSRGIRLGEKLSQLKFLFEIAFLANFATFVKNSLEFVDFRADFYRNFTKSCRINENIIRSNLRKIAKTYEN